MRLHRGSEQTSCRLLGTDPSGALRVQQAEQVDGHTRTREITITADRYNLDIHQSIIYPTVD